MTNGREVICEDYWFQYHLRNAPEKTQPVYVHDRCAKSFDGLHTPHWNAGTLCTQCSTHASHRLHTPDWTPENWTGECLPAVRPNPWFKGSLTYTERLAQIMSHVGVTAAEAAKAFKQYKQWSQPRMPTKPGFEALHQIFQKAYDRVYKLDQKGMQRHGNRETDLYEQPILTIPRMLGDTQGLTLSYQALKKIHEALRLTGEDSENELLDVLVFVAVLILLRRGDTATLS